MELSNVWVDELKDYSIFMTKMEIRDMRKAYGRPLDEWNGMVLVSPFEDVIPTKAILKRVFKIAAQINYDPTAIDKVVAYKMIKKHEVERCFTWMRGQPLDKQVISF